MKFSAFEELAKADKKTLEKILREGRKPRISAIRNLVEREFDGYNTNPFTVLFGNKKFRKTFRANDFGELMFGYNIKVKQNKLSEPWIKTSGAFGFFVVEFFPGNAYQELKPYENALLLDYGKFKNNGLFEGKYLRDVLVQVEENLFLGKAYHAFAGRLIPLSYFVMKPAERNWG